MVIISKCNNLCLHAMTLQYLCISNRKFFEKNLQKWETLDNFPKKMNKMQHDIKFHTTAATTKNFQTQKKKQLFIIILV